MKKNSLEELLIVEEDNKLQFIPDYEVFSDKEVLEEIRSKIIESLMDQSSINFKVKKEKLDYFIEKELERYDLTTLERGYIYNLIENEVIGYGPITELLKDKNVTEIMINGPDDIYVEMDGYLAKDETISFINENHILRTVEKMIQPLGKTLDNLHPIVDVRLEDGSRLNAIIPPLSAKGPVITIHKRKQDMDTMDDLIRNGTLTPYMARFLKACVEARLNIIVCGGARSGKTTLLNVLSNFIDDKERIITIEDTIELQLKQPHVVSLEAKKQKEGMTIRDLIKNAFRMRPDRIIVGEVQKEEALDVLQAMNTGYNGSITTLHANSPIDSIYRIEMMSLMKEKEIPTHIIREYIANAIDIVIEIKKLSDGRRKITNISEVLGIKEQEIILQSIFEFREESISESGNVLGEFVLYNYIPKVYQNMKQKKRKDLEDIFDPIEQANSVKSTSKKEKTKK